MGCMLPQILSDVVPSAQDDDSQAGITTREMNTEEGLAPCQWEDDPETVVLRLSRAVYLPV